MMKKRLIAVAMCLTLSFSFTIPSFAKSSGNSITATLDRNELMASDSDQTVSLTVASAAAMDLDGISYTLTVPASLEVSSIVSGNNDFSYGATDYNLKKSSTETTETAYVGWSTDKGDSGNYTGIKTIGVIEITVPGGTPAGEYTIQVGDLELTKDYGDIYENEAAPFAKLTISEATPGYTVSMSADPASVEAGQEFDVKLDVTSVDKENFNDFYAELSYDKDLVEYAGQNSGTGYVDVEGYSISKAVSDTNNAEKLIIQTHGETNIAVSKSPDLTLPFKAKTDVSGDAEFSLQNAKVDQLNNANTDAASAALGDPITVKITEPKVYYTVTFDANGHGTAPSVQTVERGQKAADPGELTAEGWTFGGWYKETACTTAWSFDTDTVTGDLTLYAKWTEIKPEVDTKTDYLSGYTLVIVTLDNADGYIPAYDGKAMYKVASVEGQSAYGDSTYYYVVKNEDYDVSKVKCIKSDSNTIKKDGNANQTTLIDINDAQFIYNLYNSVQVTYIPTADQLLASDVNGNGSVDMNDCAAAIAAIPVQWS